MTTTLAGNVCFYLYKSFSVCVDSSWPKGCPFCITFLVSIIRATDKPLRINRMCTNFLEDPLMHGFFATDRSPLKKYHNFLTFRSDAKKTLRKNEWKNKISEYIFENIFEKNILEKKISKILRKIVGCCNQLAAIQIVHGTASLRSRIITTNEIHSTCSRLRDLQPLHPKTACQPIKMV